MNARYSKWVEHEVSMRDNRYKHRDYVGNLKGSEHLQGEGVHGTIKSVCTLNMCGGREGFELIPWKYEGTEVPENH
jgi:hypothetical protein